MPNVMIIGASRGIGLELARQYAGDGWRVHATTRNPNCPGELGELSGELEIHPLEVTHASQLDALTSELAGESIDVLIHNAGVYGNGMSCKQVMRINAEAPIAVVEALLPSVTRSEQGKIVLVTSQLGARRGSTRSLGKYGDSKAALNDRFRHLENEWRDRGCLAIVVHPGWVRTDMGGPNASISVEQSASGIRELVDNLTPAQHGRF